ncbi:nicotinate-nucleotide--dimethylbenzimidazole phosphoribosyltransferase [Stackebrandtia endophytica]|uniref:Nicotinate-nucleotide--dimethylbenzimidazole phosphoribosyltransferase n=1 Tax=Stackebrandtia endophytica TaxID=1496996 RepID=A0A543B2W8_9ACTN|nr:nicotinate-nucleotide--dimethylbenzimidazole phosphoribosyltransferase [Stackebrandtia endophytica]TQL79175.1 nicotinate-nucleotide--dimethylbenzimidazole phosphoribosyltransferase [Stackebrandtia endophytica]
MSDVSPTTVLDKVKVPFPDAAYATRATNRLASALLPGSGLGSLANVVSWAGRVQATAEPTPFKQIEAILVSGATTGGFTAGDTDESAADHRTLLDRLATDAGVTVRPVTTETTSAAEDGPVLTDEQYAEAIALGRETADGCIDSGADLLVLAGFGPGAVAAAVAVTAHMTRTSAVELSPRIQLPGGVIDDNIWMRRIAATRDAFARANGAARNARTTLSEFGGAVIATMTGVIVAAGLRRTPVLFDGPIAASAALAARDFSLGAPKWCYAPDRSPHPVVEKVAGQVGMAKPVGPGMDIGEGCAVLYSLPLLQSTLRLAGELPYPAPVTETTEESTGDSGAEA